VNGKLSLWAIFTARVALFGLPLLDQGQMGIREPVGGGNGRRE
jgi:hypothetical protein